MDVRSELAGRVRVRRLEIEEAIFVRVRDVVPDPVGDRDVEYVAGLRAAVAAAVDYGLTGIELGDEQSRSIPPATVAQARRAARSGIGLDAVLRRYIVGHALLWDFIMEEATRVESGAGESGLRDTLRSQASLLDRLVRGVAREHLGERERAGRSQEQRLLERVRMLLAGERVDGADLGYELDAEHVGVIARGAGARAAMRDLAQGLNRRLLSVAHGGETVWAWLGGQRAVDMSALERTASELVQTRSVQGAGVVEGRVAGRSAGLSFAVGEPARGFEGWRSTHRQAQAALVVALRRPAGLTRYGDVALLAVALADEALARSLTDVYLSPLEDARGGGPVLRRTLHAYVAAQRNVSSAAIVLGVARSTIENRLRTIEKRLGRSLLRYPAQLEVALQLDELGGFATAEDATAGSEFV